jgi:hypothetical protein
MLRSDHSAKSCVEYTCSSSSSFAVLNILVDKHFRKQWVYDFFFFSVNRLTRWTHCSQSSRKDLHSTRTTHRRLALFTGVDPSSTASSTPSFALTPWMTWWPRKWENR